MSETKRTYRGFEQGPIRPPSEAYSLLIRVTRNCPWNRCAFCPVYKGSEFSLRPVEHVKRDVDAVHRHVEALRQLADKRGRVPRDEFDQLVYRIQASETNAFAAAVHWFFRGHCKSVFLQDANSLAARPRDLVEILTHLRERFPNVKRVTSYARSQTVAQRKLDDLRAIRAAGLDRLHIGLESGSDEVLERVAKGCTKQMHIDAGLKAKQAGFEVSEYVMPGLGGRELSELHALESADALNKINPDFIRLRTLAIPRGIPLFEEQRDGRFEKCDDETLARELLTFIENLRGITSIIKSDHILNLFADLQGRLPEDRDKMITILRTFLEMDAECRARYQLGRRLGIFFSLRHMDDPDRMALVEARCRSMGVTAENVDAITDQIVQRFV